MSDSQVQLNSEPQQQAQTPEAQAQEPQQQANATEAQAPDAKEPQNSLLFDASQVQQVVDGISDLLHGRKLTEALIIRVVANCMILTSKMKLQNHVKKGVVIAALEKYIKTRSDLSQDEVDALMTIVDVVVSDAIDVIADVKKGRIDLSTKTCCVIV